MHDGRETVRYSKDELVELCARMKAGCIQSRDQLFTQMWALMHSQVKRMGARELVFGMELRIPHMLQKFDPLKNTLSSYVCACTRYWVYRQYELKGREMDVKTYAKENWSHLQQPECADIEDDEDTRELKDIALKCLGELTESQRSLFVDRYIHGMTAQAIGDKRGMSNQWALMGAKDALARLKKKMAAELNTLRPRMGGWKF